MVQTNGTSNSMHGLAKDFAQMKALKNTSDNMKSLSSITKIIFLKTFMQRTCLIFEPKIKNTLS